jgi:hypothetical protein
LFEKLTLLERRRGNTEMAGVADPSDGATTHF